MRRLLRALQQGGVAAEVSPDIWAVWRGLDRRRCRIGTLSGAEIDLLRLHEFLRRPAAGRHCLLRWRAGDASDLEQALDRLTRPIQTMPVLDQLVLFRVFGQERAAIVQIARAIRRDSGMSCGAELTEPDTDAACSRLGAVTDQLSVRDCRFLNRLVNGDATTADLVDQFSLRPDAVRTKAVNLLREVDQIYAPVASA
ncbi:MAG: hypothetical protein AAFW60_00365 [Pseudomonadota bacterium]